MRIRAAVVVGVLALGSAGLVACGSDDDASTDSATPGGTVEGVTWTVAELGGEAPPEGVSATLEYDGTAVSGSSGCNNYNGAATFEDGTAEISGALAGTMMACEPPISDFEAAFLAALPTATTYSVDGDTLTLSGDAGVIATFTAG